jgi:hypothetical protein
MNEPVEIGSLRGPDVRRGAVEVVKNVAGAVRRALAHPDRTIWLAMGGRDSKPQEK